MQLWKCPETTYIKVERKYCSKSRKEQHLYHNLKRIGQEGELTPAVTNEQPPLLGAGGCDQHTTAVAQSPNYSEEVIHNRGGTPLRGGFGMQLFHHYRT
jgi:predicted secreted protein